MKSNFAYAYPSESQMMKNGYQSFNWGSNVYSKGKERRRREKHEGEKKDQPMRGERVSQIVTVSGLPMQTENAKTMFQRVHTEKRRKTAF